MGYHFLPCEREQLYLLPPALQDWLRKARRGSSWKVAQMNLTAMTRA